MSKKGKKPAAPSGRFLVCRNPKATMNYIVEEKFEMGIMLQGSEVKSLRDKRASLEGSYASVVQGELFLHKMHIGEYKQAGYFGHATKASRKLLAHKREIQRIQGQLSTRGYTLIPIQVYFRKGFAKVEVGLAKHKQHEDRREDLKRNIALKEAKRAMGKGGGGTR